MDNQEPVRDWSPDIEYEVIKSTHTPEEEAIIMESAVNNFIERIKDITVKQAIKFNKEEERRLRRETKKANRRRKKSS